jgi:hypothetical protein
MTVMMDFLGIENPDFRGGARTAAGELDGDGFDEVVVGDGEGSGSTVTASSGRSCWPATRPAVPVRRLPGHQRRVFVG